MLNLQELLAARSSKLAALLKENPEDDLSHLLGEIPTDSETFELVARFYHGFDINLSPENVIKVLCLAHYLGVSEIHSTNNLAKKACLYFQSNVLPSWNKGIKALKSAEPFFNKLWIFPWSMPLLTPLSPRYCMIQVFLESR